MPYRCIYIVDDDPLMLDTMCGLLAGLGFDTKPFDSGAALLESVDWHTPAPVLLDVRMPKMDGLSVLARLREFWPTTAVIMVSGKADVALAVRAMRAGATNFIEKPVSMAQLKDALTDAGCLEHQPSSRVAQVVEVNEPLDALTPREVDVLQLLVDGLQNKEIADKLDISHRTVEVHRARIMQRSGAHSFAQLIKLALQSGRY